MKESFDIDAWMNILTGKMHEAFAERLVFVGLQGSHARKEADAKSDIDAVVLLDDALSLEDLNRYRAVLDGLPEHEKACGFISDIETLRHWDRADLFALCYDTVPYFGNLDFISAQIAAEDVKRAIHTGACSIYHMCCHNLLYDQSFGLLQSLYKSAVFVIRARCFTETGTYFASKTELAKHCGTGELAILQLSTLLRNAETVSDAQFREDSRILLEWSREMIQKYGT